MKERQKIKFGNTEKSIDSLAQKVLSGQKTATSSLLDYYRSGLKEMSRVDDCVSVLDSSDKEVAIVRITRMQLMRFKDIPESFAIEEGDGSLDSWIKIHQAYYSNQLADIGKKLIGDTELVCEWFEVIKE